MLGLPHPKFPCESPRSHRITPGSPGSASFRADSKTLSRICVAFATRYDIESVSRLSSSWLGMGAIRKRCIAVSCAVICWTALPGASRSGVSLAQDGQADWVKLSPRDSSSFDHSDAAIVTVDGYAYVVPAACIPRRHLGSSEVGRTLDALVQPRQSAAASQKRTLGSAEDGRQLASSDLGRQPGADESRRNLGSAEQGPSLGSDEAARNFGSSAQDRQLASAEERRSIGSDAQDRQLGSSQTAPSCRVATDEQGFEVSGFHGGRLSASAGKTVLPVTFAGDIAEVRLP